MVYNALNRLTQEIRPMSEVTHYEYDEAGNLEETQDARNQTTTYTYTDKGLLETTTLPNGTVIKYVYNALGQKVQEIEDNGGLNLTTSYTYDHSGNLETRTDPEGVVTRYTYDALGRVKTVVDTLSQTTSYAYDSAGNLRSLTDAEQQASGFAYNGLGQVTGESRPMGESTSYTYTDAGKLETKTDANGQRTEYVYEDGTNLLTDIYYFDSSDTQTGHVSFTYERGQLSGYDDGDISATYAYNAFGQKLSETVTYPDFSKTFSYTYDNNGQKRSFTMPDGSTVSYTYDAANQLSSIRIPGVGNVSYSSYTLGRPDSMSSPGDTRSYTYDALARLDSLDSSTLEYSYSYDDVGNILTKTTGDGNYVYDYDDVYRVTDVDNPTLDDEAYTYDGVGNRLTASDVSGDITHNANNELEYYGDITYDYDANGNMTAKTSDSESWAYTYNVQNRLVQVEEDSLLVAEYGYDPFGRRLWKDVGGTRTYFLYADEGLVAEYDATGTEIRSYGYQPDSTWTTDPLWLKEGGSYYWYQNDHLGTPQKLIDMNGTVVWSAQYTAFGEAVVDVETVTNNLHFPGQYEDAETGLHYNFHRYYDPRIGRYLRTDPIGFEAGDANLYVYAWNNSVNWMDIMGLYERSCDEDKQKFFNWLKGHIPQMAKDLDVPEDIIWALAVKEAGWSNTEKSPKNPELGKLDQNIKDNAAFGRQRPDHQNKEYPTLDEAIKDWVTTGVEIPFGDRVKGKKTPREFAEALQCEGIVIPEGKICKKYNSETPTWVEDFIDRYNQVVGEPDSPEEYRRKGFKDLCRKVCDLGEE